MPHCKSKKNCDLRPVPGSQASPRAEIDLLIDRVADLIASKPEKAVIILADWISRAGSKPRKKAG